MVAGSLKAARHAIYGEGGWLNGTCLGTQSSILKAMWEVENLEILKPDSLNEKVRTSTQSCLLTSTCIQQQEYT